MLTSTYTIIHMFAGFIVLWWGESSKEKIDEIFLNHRTSLLHFTSDKFSTMVTYTSQIVAVFTWCYSASAFFMVILRLLPIIGWTPLICHRYLAGTGGTWSEPTERKKSCQTPSPCSLSSFLPISPSPVTTFHYTYFAFAAIHCYTGELQTLKQDNSDLLSKLHFSMCVLKN